MVFGTLTRAEFVFDKPDAQDRKLLGFSLFNYAMRDCAVKSDVKFTFKLEDLDGEVSKKMSAAIKSGGKLLSVKLPGAGGKKVKVNLEKVTDDRTGIYYHPDDLLKPMPASDAIDRAINNFLIFMFHADNSAEFGFFHSYSRAENDKQIAAFSSWCKMQALKQGQYFSNNEDAGGLYTFGKNGVVSVDITTYGKSNSLLNTYVGNAYRYGQTATEPKKKPEVVINAVEEEDSLRRKVWFEIKNLGGLGNDLKLDVYSKGGFLSAGVEEHSYLYNEVTGSMFVQATLYYGMSNKGDESFTFKIEVPNGKDIDITVAPK